MGEITIGEKQAYSLLFEKHLNATEASRRLAAQGIDMSPEQLRNFKAGIYTRLMTEDKLERMSEMMLESVDRIKFEFEDLNAQTKLLLQQAIDDNDRKSQLEVLREIKEQLFMALKYLGEFKTSVSNINAKNINIINQGDLSEAFKRVQTSWFESMDAKLENGKLVFNYPSPELVDDYHKWNAKKLREAEPSGITIDAEVIEEQTPRE